jgi:hypothetical protein
MQTSQRADFNEFPLYPGLQSLHVPYILFWGVRGHAHGPVCHAGMVWRLLFLDLRMHRVKKILPATKEMVSWLAIRGQRAESASFLLEACTDAAASALSLMPNLIHLRLDILGEWVPCHNFPGLAHLQELHVQAQCAEREVVNRWLSKMGRLHTLIIKLRKAR